MIPRLEAVLRPVAFILLVTVLCGAIFEFAGHSAFLMFNSILDGAFLGRGALEKSLRWALPLFITAVGVGISFRCGYFNIGAQGQFYMGGICAAFTADFLLGAPALLAVPLGILAGMAGGALWALWPGYLRLRSGTDEVITTLMGNFIAALILVHVTSGPLKDPSGSGQQASTRILAARVPHQRLAWRVARNHRHRRPGRRDGVVAGEPDRLRNPCGPCRAQSDDASLSGRTDLAARPVQLPHQRCPGRACGIDRTVRPEWPTCERIPADPRLHRNPGGARRQLRGCGNRGLGAVLRRPVFGCPVPADPCGGSRPRRSISSMRRSPS